MRSARRRGFTLLEVFLTLVISAVLIAAITSALNIHLRITESGRTEVEQAQLARALLGRIADDLRIAVPHIKPVPSIAGATSDEIAAAAAAALGEASLPSGSSGGAPGGGSSGGGASGSSSGGASSGSSGGSGTQTLQPLKTLGTLSTLKPQSASSSSSPSGASGGASGGSSSGSSGSKSSSSGGSSTGSSSGNATDSESSAEASAAATPPGIYGDQFNLQIDVSRPARGGMPVGGAVGLVPDAPGDVKTVRYQVLNISGPPGDPNALSSGLYRESTDKSVANFESTSGASPTATLQLLASEVAAIEFRYFDGTAWQVSWDSSASGALPTAVEVLITLNPPQTAAVSSSPTLTLPQVYRLTVAIPAAQVSGTSTETATDAAAESSESSSTSSSSSSSSGTTP